MYTFKSWGDDIQCAAAAIYFWLLTTWYRIYIEMKEAEVVIWIYILFALVCIEGQYQNMHACWLSVRDRPMNKNCKPEIFGGYSDLPMWKIYRQDIDGFLEQDPKGYLLWRYDNSANPSSISRVYMPWFALFLGPNFNAFNCPIEGNSCLDQGPG